MRFLFPEGTPNALRGCPEGARMLTGQLQLSYQDNISVRVWGNSALWQLKNPDAVSHPSLFRSFEKVKVIDPKKILGNFIYMCGPRHQLGINE